MRNIIIPTQYAGRELAELTREELLTILEANEEGGIRISFSGKSNARRIARDVRPRVGKVIAKYSTGTAEERARNFVIEGDNLQAMATLYKERGLVDLILTDPPYNTGQDFRYNDRWEEDPNDPGMGELVSEEDGGRHTKWMRFMWPRLQMMKSMLKPAGVLAICIDHRELFRLGQMLDELFGEVNRIAIINWQKSAAPRSDNKHVSTSTEYVLVYAKDLAKAKTGALERTEDDNSRYSNPDNDPNGLWREGNLSARSYSAEYDYAIQSPFTGELHYPAGNGAWRHPKNNIRKWLSEWGPEYEERDIKDNRGAALMIKGKSDKTAFDKARARLKKKAWPFLWFGRDGQGRPRVKTYLEQIRKGKVPVTYWADDDELPNELDATSWDFEESGRTSDGVSELTKIVGGGHGFTTVKPLKLFRKIMQIWCGPEGVVLDPFSGSGTTGHAVLELNSEQGALRRYILIEQGRPENGDSYARSLLAERLRRVTSGKWASGSMPPLQGGFTFMSLGKKVDAAALLEMEREEMVDTVIASHFDETRRRGDQLIRIESTATSRFRYLVAKNADGEGFFLVWDGANRNTDFTESVYEVCAKEAAQAGLKKNPYHVYARLYRFQTDGIKFYQIPDRILADFGLDLKSEPFETESEEVA